MIAVVLEVKMAQTDDDVEDPIATVLRNICQYTRQSEQVQLVRSWRFGFTKNRTPVILI